MQQPAWIKLKNFDCKSKKSACSREQRNLFYKWEIPFQKHWLLYHLKFQVVVIGCSHASWYVWRVFLPCLGSVSPALYRVTYIASVLQKSRQQLMFLHCLQLMVEWPYHNHGSHFLCLWPVRRVLEDFVCKVDCFTCPKQCSIMAVAFKYLQSLTQWMLCFREAKKQRHVWNVPRQCMRIICSPTHQWHRRPTDGVGRKLRMKWMQSLSFAGSCLYTAPTSSPSDSSIASLSAIKANGTWCWQKKKEKRMTCYLGSPLLCEWQSSDLQLY